MSTVNELLQPGSVGARLIQVLLVATQIAFALPSIDGTLSDLPTVASLVLFTLGVGLVGMRAAGALPLPATLAVIVIGLIINVLMMPTFPPSGWPGYDSWNFGAMTWLLFFLALRERIVWAWVGFLGMTVITVIWVIVIDRPLLEGTFFLTRHAGTLLMGTVFQVILHRSFRAIGAMEQARIDQAAKGAAAEALVRDGDLWARRLDTLVRPVLDIIASRAEITERDRVEFELVEESLRDILRGGDLASPEILRLARESRLRGAAVTLIDDSGGATPPAVLDLMVAELRELLRTLTHGQLTARLLPPERDLVATIVRDGADGYVRREFTGA